MFCRQKFRLLKRNCMILKIIIFEYKLKLQSHIAIDKFIFILFSIHKDIYVYRKIQIFLKKKSFIKKINCKHWRNYRTIFEIIISYMYQNSNTLGSILIF